MRASKLNTEAIDENCAAGSRQRPGAFTMMRDFYKGYANPETRAATLQHGRAVQPKSTKRLPGDEIHTDGERNIGEGF